MDNRSVQPWLASKTFDLIWIIGPAFFISGLVLAVVPLSGHFLVSVPPWVWLLCIVGVDVSHVYSTLYRTYFDPEERSRYRALLILIPLASWAMGIALYLCSSAFFWSILAYLAVFHFIRQQYGFIALYSRKENASRLSRRLDQCAIYSATLYPLIYWHAHLPRMFDWFVPGDFIFALPPSVAHGAWWVWLMVLGAQLTKEFIFLARGVPFNVPKNLFLWGTVISWYVGIILYNGDLPFTLTNVVAHGVPYIALVWLFGRRKSENAKSTNSFISWIFSLRAIPAFLAILLFLSYLEEAVWDGLVWRDHRTLFPWAWSFPIIHSPWLLAIIVPLLTVPQATHYILDAFVWKLRRPESGVRAILEG